MSTDNNPYQTPQSSVEKTNQNDLPRRYVGFWVRVGASIIDNILLIIVILPFAYAIYGKDYFSFQSTNTSTNEVFDIFSSYIFPIIATLVFWIYKQATPGKILFGAKIVDVETGEKPSVGQWIIRYIGYIPSIFILFLGLMWVGWDKRKQGWHDKMASTVVIYKH